MQTTRFSCSLYKLNAACTASSLPVCTGRLPFQQLTLRMIMYSQYYVYITAFIPSSSWEISMLMLASRQCCLVFGITQHVTSTTHIDGGILDHVYWTSYELSDDQSHWLSLVGSQHSNSQHKAEQHKTKSVSLSTQSSSMPSAPS